MNAGGELIPLGSPRAIEIRLGANGEPRALRRWRRPAVAGSMLAVRRVEEVWRLADEWWREAPLRRSLFVTRDTLPLYPAPLHGTEGWSTMAFCYP